MTSPAPARACRTAVVPRRRPRDHDRLHDHGQQQRGQRRVGLHEPRRLERPDPHRSGVPHLRLRDGRSRSCSPSRAGWRAVRPGRSSSRTPCSGRPILCVLGIVVNSFPFFALDHMRFYGVLQRIAVCYLAVSLLYLWSSRVWLIATALVWRWSATGCSFDGCPCPGRACRAATCRSWTCSRTWSRGSIASCFRITCIATCRITTSAIRKVS